MTKRFIISVEPIEPSGVVLSIAELPRPALEFEVSNLIGNMQILWLPIKDEAGPRSQRGHIERSSIAILSNYNRLPVDPPSLQWLGHHSDRERIRSSGLWNSNHVDELYDPAFLDELDQLVSATGGGP